MHITVVIIITLLQLHYYNNNYNKVEVYQIKFIYVGKLHIDLLLIIMNVYADQSPCQDHAQLVSV